MSLDLLKHEWTTLHQEHERHDRYSLLIKLTAVLVCLLALAFNMGILLSTVFIATLWLQEGIWRTIQARTGARLLEIEQQLAAANGQMGLQHYSVWQENRPGTAGLVKEYIINALRPTVAYPYVILTGLLVVIFLTEL